MTTEELEMFVSEQMSNAPLYYALVQARFSPVPLMAEYEKKIQDRLRHKGYPEYDLRQVTQLVLPGPGHVKQDKPEIKQTDSWLYSRNDRTEGFILMPSAITFHTTHYQNHKEFIKSLLLGLETVHEVVKPDHVSRLGLRYLNAVLPSDGETVEQYLVGGLHGVELNMNITRRYTMAESIFATETGPLLAAGTLRSRVHRTQAVLGFPQDLVHSGLVDNPRFESKKSQDHAVIDIDHYVEGRMSIDMDKLSEQLLSLHATIKTIFRATVTDHARAAWA